MSAATSRHRTFADIRYSQVWEDADVLLEALDIQPEDECVSIASAGDNALALLSRRPQRVIALDINPAQLSCLALRVAAFRTLTYGELLEFAGARPSEQRETLYDRVRGALEPSEQLFWDARRALLRKGFCHVGKFEKGFRFSLKRLLPLVHSQKTIEALLESRSRNDRITFYETHWNTWRWRLYYRLFFSYLVMEHLGRDLTFFRHLKKSMAVRFLVRERHILTELDPSENPYLWWVLKGEYGPLPFWLREENFEPIRSCLDRLEIRRSSIEDFLTEQSHTDVRRIKWNLSNIFDYVSAQHAETIFSKIADCSATGSRLAFWDTLVSRTLPTALRTRIRPLEELSARLHGRDKAFYFSNFTVGEIQCM